jgi:hypothetical protein
MSFIRFFAPLQRLRMFPEDYSRFLGFVLHRIYLEIRPFHLTTLQTALYILAEDLKCEKIPPPALTVVPDSFDTMRELLSILGFGSLFWFYSSACHNRFLALVESLELPRFWNPEERQAVETAKPILKRRVSAGESGETDLRYALIFYRTLLAEGAKLRRADITGQAIGNNNSREEVGLEAVSLNGGAFAALDEPQKAFVRALAKLRGQLQGEPAVEAPSHCTELLPDLSTPPPEEPAKEKDRQGETGQNQGDEAGSSEAAAKEKKAGDGEQAPKEKIGGAGDKGAKGKQGGKDRPPPAKPAGPVVTPGKSAAPNPLVIARSGQALGPVVTPAKPAAPNPLVIATPAQATGPVVTPAKSPAPNALAIATGGQAQGPAAETKARPPPGQGPGRNRPPGTDRGPNFAPAPAPGQSPRFGTGPPQSPRQERRPDPSGPTGYLSGAPGGAQVGGRGPPPAGPPGPAPGAAPTIQRPNKTHLNVERKFP